eukprot:m.993022 g.993022  ORF g.993022 m.993022 type:complete len:396 (-) comp24009_c0_seq4:1067-2254(-)
MREHKLAPHRIQGSGIKHRLVALAGCVRGPGIIVDKRRPLRRRGPAVALQTPHDHWTACQLRARSVRRQCKDKLLLELAVVHEHLQAIPAETGVLTRRHFRRKAFISPLHESRPTKNSTTPQKYPNRDTHPFQLGAHRHRTNTHRERERGVLTLQNRDATTHRATYRGRLQRRRHARLGQGDDVGAGSRRGPRRIPAHRVRVAKHLIPPNDDGGKLPAHDERVVRRPRTHGNPRSDPGRRHGILLEVCYGCRRSVCRVNDEARRAVHVWPDRVYVSAALQKLRRRHRSADGTVGHRHGEKHSAGNGRGENRNVGGGVVGGGCQMHARPSRRCRGRRAPHTGHVQLPQHHGTARAQPALDIPLCARPDGTRLCPRQDPTCGRGWRQERGNVRPSVR